MPHTRLMILGLLAASCLPGLAAANSYSFDDYGFRLRVPGRYQQARNGEADHGWAFFLDHWTHPTRFESDDRPYISAFASYAFDEAGLADLRREYCKGRLAPQPDLAFADAHSTSCMVLLKGGWRDVWVLAYGGEPGGRENASAIIYHMRLHTRVDRFARDMAVFQDAVRSMRIALPR